MIDVTQIRGGTTQPLPPSPQGYGAIRHRRNSDPGPPSKLSPPPHCSTAVGTFAFIAEKTPAISSLVDWHRIVSHWLFWGEVFRVRLAIMQGLVARYSQNDDYASLSIRGYMSYAQRGRLRRTLLSGCHIPRLRKNKGGSVAGYGIRNCVHERPQGHHTQPRARY